MGCGKELGSSHFVASPCGMDEGEENKNMFKLILGRQTGNAEPSPRTALTKIRTLLLYQLLLQFGWTRPAATAAAAAIQTTSTHD